MCISVRHNRRSRCHRNHAGLIHPFIYSFTLQDTSIATLQVHHYSETLPTTSFTLCHSFTPKRFRQLRVKDLPKVPTWRQELNSNPRPWRREAPNIRTLSHPTPRLMLLLLHLLDCGRDDSYLSGWISFLETTLVLRRRSTQTYRMPSSRCSRA